MKNISKILLMIIVMNVGSLESSNRNYKITNKTSGVALVRFNYDSAYSTVEITSNGSQTYNTVAPIGIAINMSQLPNSVVGSLQLNLTPESFNDIVIDMNKAKKLTAKIGKNSAKTFDSLNSAPTKAKQR